MHKYFVRELYNCHVLWSILFCTKGTVSRARQGRTPVPFPDGPQVWDLLLEHEETLLENFL